MDVFNKNELKKLYKPKEDSSGEDNGQVVIIGGSSLFHGAPMLSVRAASRIVDMVFFSSPHEPMHEVAAYMKSIISSFIWIPWEETEDYVKKSDAVLIGPGFMRASSETNNHTQECDEECEKTRTITKHLLDKFPDKKWVIDAGSLQTMDKEWIPQNAILTPNKKEYKMLFGELSGPEAAKQHKCTIVLKGPTSYVYSPEKSVEVKGGNPGMTKGGTGDVMAGLAVALLAKNDAFLAAAASAQVVKTAGDDLFAEQGIYFNADDLAAQIPQTLFTLL